LGHDRILSARRRDFGDFAIRWRDRLSAFGAAIFRTLYAGDGCRRMVARTRLGGVGASFPPPEPVSESGVRPQLGKPVSGAWVRKTLQRGHDKYADLLLDEVAHSLPAATPESLRQELQELDLFKYCGAALQRWSP
jgi:hypothetical protein